MGIGFPDFFRFNLWANLRLLDACAQLSDTQLDGTLPGTYGSVRQTLMHLVSSDEGYARHGPGSALMPHLKETDEFPGFDDLRKRAEHSGNQLIAFAEQGDLSRVLHLDDGTYDATVMIVLLQAIDHGIDHRSQIATLLSQFGIEAPGLDAWSYNDDKRPGLSK